MRARPRRRFDGLDARGRQELGYTRCRRLRAPRDADDDADAAEDPPETPPPPPPRLNRGDSIAAEAAAEPEPRRRQPHPRAAAEPARRSESGGGGLARRSPRGASLPSLGRCSPTRHPSTRFSPDSSTTPRRPSTTHWPMRACVADPNSSSAAPARPRRRRGLGKAGRSRGTGKALRQGHSGLWARRARRAVAALVCRHPKGARPGGIDLRRRPKRKGLRTLGELPGREIAGAAETPGVREGLTSL